MREVVILSGKGGTGKTTVTAALADLAARERRVVLADADVDAANLELLLSPARRATHDFAGGEVATIDEGRCRGCGRCVEVCRFGAVEMVADDGPPRARIAEVGCEGCAACRYECPTGAIAMVAGHSGEWFLSDTRFGPLVHARLFAGRENSGKLVSVVKMEARQIARSSDSSLLLIDGPPGIGCPVIAAAGGADLALLVTEPSVAGVHDLDRALGLLEHFGVRPLVCINKWDLNPARSAGLEAELSARDVPVIGRLPFDPVVTRAMVAGRTITEGEWAEGAVAREIEKLWERLRAVLGETDRRAAPNRPIQLLDVLQPGQRPSALARPAATARRDEPTATSPEAASEEAQPGRGTRDE